MYLEEARPWTDAESRQIVTAMANLTSDQRMLANHIARAILSLGGQPSPGPFPSVFASFNDVSLEYLLPKIIERMQSDIETIHRYANDLALAPSARELAEEVLGNLRGHQELLDELAEEEVASEELA